MPVRSAPARVSPCWAPFVRKVTHGGIVSLARGQAATAPLQNLSSKLVKARHCLHAVTLQVEATRSECDRARKEVEASDAIIAAMEQEEERLKLQYVESAPASQSGKRAASAPRADVARAGVRQVSSRTRSCTPVSTPSSRS